MSIGDLYGPFGGIVALLVVAIAIRHLTSSRRRSWFSGWRNRYVARTFLTGNELEFLGRLERALPECRIHCQVSMGALLNATEKGLAARAKFSQKMIDYVVQDRRGGKVIAVVELDDRTHVGVRDRERDAMMAQAGYRTLRFNAKNKPSEQRIRAIMELEPLTIHRTWKP